MNRVSPHDEEDDDFDVNLSTAIRKRDYNARRHPRQISRRKLVVWLRKKHRHRMGARVLASKLARCLPPNGCHSAVCPDCGRAAQKRLTRLLKEATRHVKVDEPIVFVTAASLEFAVSPERLRDFEHWKMTKTMQEACAAAEISWAVFAIDVSINEHGTNRYPLYAMPHLHGIVVTASVDRLRDALKAAFQPSDVVPRPVRVTRWDGNTDAFRYLLKQQLDRRIGIDGAERFDPKTGTTRLCRAVLKDRPRSAERREMLVFLDRVGMDGRVIFVNAQLAHMGRRVRIVTPADAP